MYPLYSVSLATIAAHEVARQPFINYWSHASGVYSHCSLVLRLNTTALLEAMSKQSHREGCLLKLNGRKKCDQKELQWRRMKAYCVHSVTMATIHFWSTLPLVHGYHGNRRYITLAGMHIPHLRKYISFEIISALSSLFQTHTQSHTVQTRHIMHSRFQIGVYTT